MSSPALPPLPQGTRMPSTAPAAAAASPPIDLSAGWAWPPATAAPPRASFPMPAALEEYLQQLESWALANKKDSRTDSFKFWSFKIPGIFAATGSGVFASIHLPPFITLIIGLIGGACVTLDGILRPGKLRSVHIRALHDLRNLQNIVRNQWLMAALEGRNSDAAAGKILADAETKRIKIAAYLEAVEADPLDSAVSPPSNR